MKKKKRPTAMQLIGNYIVLIVGLLCIAYYLALGLSVRFGQSLMFVWPVAGILCIAHFVLWQYLFRTGQRPAAALSGIIRAVFTVCIVFFLAVECIIFFGGRVTPAKDLDYIIILGAKVNGREPSGSLRNRITTASDYLKKNPDTLAILSGGQGADEEISEAACMLERLTDKGIASERLIIEDASTDTSENLIFSFEKIDDESSSVGLVTNDFHLFRAMALARGLGHSVSGVPVATTWISFPHYMMREFVGVLYDGLRGNLAFH